MVNINAQTWLDEKYPLNGVCERDKDKENKNKKREDITKLDIGEGKVGNVFKSKVLIGSLKLERFTKLRKLTISSHQITELDASNCPNLEEINCSSNELTSLNVVGCSNLKKINCYNNNIKELDLSTCIKLTEINCASNNSLEEVDISKCLKLTEIGPEFTHKENKLIRNISQITLAENSDTRNILVVGITGNGKSALANVLTKTKQFKEGESSTSVTKNFKRSDVFEWEKNGKKIKYRVIDNIGFGDSNNLSQEDILYEIGKAVHSAKEGINQVLFVFKGRFSEEQIVAFNMFKDFIAETGITRVTTLVRTNFPKFKDRQECTKDQGALFNEGNEELSKIIKSCKGGIVYVDNPLIPEIDKEDSDNEEEIEIRNKKRKDSRKKVLDHLAENCPEIYKVEKWESIHNQVAEYVKKKEEIERKSINSDQKQTEIEKARQRLAEEIKVRLGINPVALDAYIEVEVKNCCSIS